MRTIAAGLAGSYLAAYLARSGVPCLPSPVTLNFRYGFPALPIETIDWANRKFRWRLEVAGSPWSHVFAMDDEFRIGSRAQFVQIKTVCFAFGGNTLLVEPVQKPV